MEFNKEAILERCNALCKGTLMEGFGITIIDATPTSLTAQMPLSQAVMQPEGVLHGGASAALAETVGSMAAMVLVATPQQMVRGIDVMMSHTGAVKEGSVLATATCLHKGRTLQHWDIKITDEQNRLISYGKHTTILIAK